MAMEFSLNHDFREFVESLNRHNVRYLIVGGYAVGFHGHPRYTKDLDVWVDTETENIQKLLLSLAEFGFGELGLEVSDFEQEGQVIQLGREPVRIDLLTSVKGVNFADASSSQLTAQIGGVDVRVIGLEDLRTAKLAAGRPQDLADVDHLS